MVCCASRPFPGCNAGPCPTDAHLYCSLLLKLSRAPAWHITVQSPAQTCSICQDMQQLCTDVTTCAIRGFSFRDTPPYSYAQDLSTNFMTRTMLPVQMPDCLSDLQASLRLWTTTITPSTAPQVRILFVCVACCEVSCFICIHKVHSNGWKIGKIVMRTCAALAVCSVSKR